MTYRFPVDVEEQIQEQLATGGYSSQDDVLREALRALRWRNQEVAAIQEGIEDMEAGYECEQTEARCSHAAP